MPESDSSAGSSLVLRLEVIDDVGRVVDTIYVPEITSGSCPTVRRRTTEEHALRRTRK